MNPFSRPATYVKLWGRVMRTEYSIKVRVDKNTQVLKINFLQACLEVSSMAKWQKLHPKKRVLVLHFLQGPLIACYGLFLKPNEKKKEKTNRERNKTTTEREIKLVAWLLEDIKTRSLALFSDRWNEEMLLLWAEGKQLWQVLQSIYSRMLEVRG